MLEVKNCSFAYKKREPVLENIHFMVGRGEHMAIMGESGCGKSTLLKIIYGLLPLDEGTVWWNDQQVLGPNYNLVPGEPNMKYLSQDFDLMPFTSVEENISQFLSVFYPKELEERTQELLEMIEMTEFGKTKVKNLSGGQQQRVALARVLAQKPELLLLDEPFSHIDNFKKNTLRRNLFEYLKKQGITCLTATHDHHDVLPFADRTLILKDRQIIAKDFTLTLYQNPKILYIATLFGEANHIPIEILKSYANTKRRIIVYAHEFKVSKSSGLPITVKKAYPMGSHFLMEGIADGQTLFFNSSEMLEKERLVYLNIPLDIINKRLA